MIVSACKKSYQRFCMLLMRDEPNGNAVQRILNSKYVSLFITLGYQSKQFPNKKPGDMHLCFVSNKRQNDVTLCCLWKRLMDVFYVQPMLNMISMN